MVADAAFAQTQGPGARHGGARRAIASHTTAAASLEGIGTVDGWGHVMVKDILLKDDSIRREMAIHLVGLSGDTEYSLTIDGFPAAELTTDQNGDARLRLSSWRDTDQPFPADLPPAAELMTATVYDPDGTVLIGDFIARSIGHQGPKNLVYLDRTRLEPADDFNLHGVARVTRDGDDQQTFETRACGLVEDSYEVEVDGAPVGVVTVDAVGHAALVLSTEDGTLPAGLDPIEDVVEVEWLNGDGETVLYGSFGGENMVGEGPLRDRLGDGDGEYGPGDRPGGSGTGGEPHGDGDCDGSGPNGGRGNGGGN
jgi:hypothetical protein